MTPWCRLRYQFSLWGMKNAARQVFWLKFVILSILLCVALLSFVHWYLFLGALVICIVALRIVQLYDARTDNGRLLFSLVLASGLLGHVGHADLVSLVSVTLVFWYLRLSSESRRATVSLDPSRFSSLFKEYSSEPGPGAVGESARPVLEPLGAAGSREHRDNTRIGLALSGGGFRAALIHAGVLYAAEHFRVRISNISSVSGGSIIGAFYCAGGRPEDFKIMCEERVFDLWREGVKLQNLPKLFFNRSALQSQLLARSGSLGTSKSTAADGPRLLICTTDLLGGYAVGITEEFTLLKQCWEPTSKHAFTNQRARPYDATVIRLRHTESFAGYSLPDLVAASGAFPLAFQSTKVSVRHKPIDNNAQTDLDLVDGGVADNTGIALLLDAQRQGEEAPAFDILLAAGDYVPPVMGWNLDAVISSDAGAYFRDQLHQGECWPRYGLLSGFGRAMDVIYRNSVTRADSRLVGMPSLFILSPEVESRRRSAQATHGMASDLNVTSLDSDTVRFLVDELPKSSRWEETELLETGLAHQLGVTNLRDAARKILEGLENQDPVSQETARGVVRLMIATEMNRCLRVYERTATLKAILSTSDIDRLFRLGVYLFAHQWSFLKARIQTLQVKNEVSDQMWSRLTKSQSASPIRGVLTRPEVQLDLADVFLLGRPVPIGITNPSSMLFEQAEEMYRHQLMGNGYAEVLAAVFAQRMAWGIEDMKVGITRRGWVTPRPSLLDEILGRVVESTDRHVYELARQIQMDAGFSGSGAVTLIDACVKKYGTGRVGSWMISRAEKLREDWAV